MPRGRPRSPMSEQASTSALQRTRRSAVRRLAPATLSPGRKRPVSRTVMFIRPETMGSGSWCKDPRRASRSRIISLARTRAAWPPSPTRGAGFSSRTARPRSAATRLRAMATMASRFKVATPPMGSLACGRRTVRPTTASKIPTARCSAARPMHRAFRGKRFHSTA